MRDLIEEELARSRSIIQRGVELVPRFRVAAEDGETLIFVQLPDDIGERVRRMSLVSSWMAVHMARSFVMATELQAPDASSAVAVTRQGCEGALQMIGRNPLSFSETLWLAPEQIGDEVAAMLPAKIEMVTAAQVAEVENLIRYNEGVRLQPL